ncbi:uncharacterized protein K460DRAFT_406209 [Cucurbitaria berberidis CBS 394.84]|uniref:Uncharacterized protein n=1 Tax=Cucurbitaria berberidis CBS 394.84 TaxID=1168544 RepID=A0A9P4GIM0_9PLEO|nr:uncharacterized protein K460DRAFT_406209 [Cucurbitaria berberidis CBS 394.84]KAF1845982.1 hypothetical protein K460DRAFT_406209 [Cucurbitaria berberidis CBS 394.84]
MANDYNMDTDMNDLAGAETSPNPTQHALTTEAQQETAELKAQLEKSQNELALTHGALNYYVDLYRKTKSDNSALRTHINALNTGRRKNINDSIRFHPTRKGVSDLGRLNAKAGMVIKKLKLSMDPALEDSITSIERELFLQKIERDDAKEMLDFNNTDNDRVMGAMQREMALVIDGQSRSAEEAAQYSQENARLTAQNRVLKNDAEESQELFNEMFNQKMDSDAKVSALEEEIAALKARVKEPTKVNAFELPLRHVEIVKRPIFAG